MLEFKDGAICLSGATGTGLKSRILGEYYPFWWRITSGGEGKSNRLHTAIVDLNAATGRVHIKDTGETILGSAGHALELKFNHPNTDRLKLILREEDQQCFGLLKEFIQEKWPKVSLADDANIPSFGQPQVFVLRDRLEKALDTIERIDTFSQLGRTIFLFDPLRSVPYDDVERVAARRVDSFYKIGTEFIIFLFTSDLFLGRDEFAGLPTTQNQDAWTEAQHRSVLETDLAMGGTSWRTAILNTGPVSDNESVVVELYKEQLHKWFRYVLALPFAPKQGQLYHLFFCSNFEIGIRVTRNFYSEFTKNPRFSPDNKTAYTKFKAEHPAKMVGIVGQRKPSEFKMLWKIIKEHEDGFADAMCEDLKEDEASLFGREKILTWLAGQGYLAKTAYSNDHWQHRWPTYRLNWNVVNSKLGVPGPLPLVPILPRDGK
jgi:three-Cys-motif partner protein